MFAAIRSKSLRFDFPEGLSAPNRIVYVLSRTGGNGCYSTVRLRTGLAPREFADAIELLKSAQKIEVDEIASATERRSVVEPQKISLSGF